MKRRNFVKTIGAVGAGSTLAAIPACDAVRTNGGLVATSDDVNQLPEPGDALVAHCKAILEQNLVVPGETFVLATPMVFDRDYMLALLVAAGELGATGLHAAVISHPFDPNAAQSRTDGPPGYALTGVHWDLYAEANLLITTSIGKAPGLPGPSTSYAVTAGDHPYASDHEYINRPGSKTRWLSLGGSVENQKQFFPTADRRDRTLRGAILLDEHRGEIRVTSDAGSDWTTSNIGRPGHAQYGIADFPGRWDNFGYGCVACAPEETIGEGVLVLQPGDVISWNPKPRGYETISESVTLNWEGGYVVSIEGGALADEYRAHMEGFGDPESLGIGHWGWGTHEASDPGYTGHYHHNHIGSLLYNIGINVAHGIGGAEAGYSGLGDSRRTAPNHSHFAMFGCDVFVGDQQIISAGDLDPIGGGLG